MAALVDAVWSGMTCPEACESLGLDFGEVYSQMPVDIRGLIIDTSMLARVREEILNANFIGESETNL